MKKKLKLIILNSEDPMYELAKEITISHQRVSAAFIQRKLRIGYFRAAKLIDMMEEDKIVGPINGAKPRKILLKKANEVSNKE